VSLFRLDARRYAFSLRHELRGGERLRGVTLVEVADLVVRSELDAADSAAGPGRRRRRTLRRRRRLRAISAGRSSASFMGSLLGGHETSRSEIIVGRFSFALAGSRIGAQDLTAAGSRRARPPTGRRLACGERERAPGADGRSGAERGTTRTVRLVQQYARLPETSTS